MCMYLHWPPLSTTCVCTYIGLHYQLPMYVLTLAFIINYICMYLHDLHYQLHLCVLTLASIINYICMYLHWPPLLAFGL